MVDKCLTPNQCPFPNGSVKICQSAKFDTNTRKWVCLMAKYTDKDINKNNNV